MSATEIRPLLDKAQVARRLGVTVRQLEYLMARCDCPPAIRVGFRWKWRPEVVEQWLEDRERAFNQGEG